MGIGHLMRCKTLADALHDEAVQCHFAVKEIHSDTALSPHSVHYLENEENFLSLIEAGDYQAVVIDHYDYSSDRLQQIKNLTRCLIVLDDECNRGNLYADIILNSVSLAAQLPYQKYAPQAELLLGSDYVLLRKEFIHCHLTDFTDRENIVVTFGGSDMNNLTLPVLKKLTKTELIKYPIVVVTGASCQKVEVISRFCVEHSIEHRHNESHMETIFAQAKFAISAAGSTVYELAKCGVPTVFSVIADNQWLSMLDHEQRGWCTKVDCRRVDHRKHSHIDEIIDKACKMLKDPELSLMSAQARRLVDGNGAHNAAKYIEKRI